jgi:hypothetical protein
MGFLKNGSTDFLTYTSKSPLSVYLILANGARSDSSPRYGDPGTCDVATLRFKLLFEPVISGAH